jgi:hypothetical protein
VPPLKLDDAASPPELDNVEETLGYSLAPGYLPEGFEFDRYDILLDEIVTIEPDGQVGAPLERLYASVDYRRFRNHAYHHIFIRYPQSFSPLGEENFLPERLGPDWQRPEDTISEVKVNGETAYLIRGSWSDDTLWELAHSDTKVLETISPMWDYEIYLSLYFDFELSQDETIGVMIQAVFYPADWITAQELVKIAESIRLMD